jgi:hypothetical protein
LGWGACVCTVTSRPSDVACKPFEREGVRSVNRWGRCARCFGKTILEKYKKDGRLFSNSHSRRRQTRRDLSPIARRGLYIKIWT